MSAEKKITVGNIEIAKVTRGASISPVEKEANKNFVPSRVKSRTAINKLPTHSKKPCINEILSTPIAKII